MTRTRSTTSSLRVVPLTDLKRLHQLMIVIGVMQLMDLVIAVVRLHHG